MSTQKETKKSTKTIEKQSSVKPKATEKVEKVVENEVKSVATKPKKEKVKRITAKNIMEKLQEHMNAYLKLVISKDGFKDNLEKTCQSVWEDFKVNLDKDLKVYTKTVIRPFRAPKDKNAPTKRRSDYIFFCMDKRKDVIKEFPDYKVTQVSVELGRRWKLLTDEEKKPYVQKSKDDKERYEDEMEGYVKPTFAEQKVVKKRGSTAYNMFCAEKRPRMKKNNEEKTGKEITKMLAEMWKETSDERKLKYRKLADEKRERENNPEGTAEDDEKAPKKTVKKPKAKAKTKRITGYNMFTREVKPDIQKENPKLKDREIASMISKKWGNMSDTKKKPYNDKAKKENGKEVTA